jgi:ABC-2 type transport system permease protein
MSFFAELQLYYIRKIKEALRNPGFLSMTVGVPFMYMVLFAPLLKNFNGMPGFGSDGVMNFFLPGVIVILSMFGGLFVGFGLIDEIRQGIVERFRVTPTSRLAILLGGVLRDVTAVLLQTILITLIALPFGLKISLGGFLLILLILGMLTSLFAAFSYALALKLKSEDALAPIMQGISMPLMLLAGFLLPMSLAPGWLLTLAHFNPVYYAVEASRALMHGQINTPVVWQTFAIILPLLIIVFRWAIKSYRSVVS